MPLKDPVPEVRALACCIVRARIASGREVDPGNDVYWHTREACVAMARSMGIKTQQLIRELSSVSNICFRGVPDREVLELSTPYWPLVSHPLVLAREVMET